MLRVAAYCRVSTSQEDQRNSLENQRRYFSEYISRQPDWELVEVYADEGPAPRPTGLPFGACWQRQQKEKLT